MSLPAYIIINPYCHQGRGWERWLTIKEEVHRQLPAAKEIVAESGVDIIEAIAAAGWHQAPGCLISAGGDGSVHYLVNALLKQNTIDTAGIILGAVGLGSSNDFLKPFHQKINNIPVRLNTASGTVWHDLGKVLYKTDGGAQMEKYFIVNASVGATAEGNWYFNHPGKLLQQLKKYSTGTAIAYTAIATILSYKNRACSISFNGMQLNAMLSNINMLKIPYVSGSFHYRQDIQPGDGRMAVNICLSMNKAELLQTLFQLGRGVFTASDKKITAFATAFVLQAEQPVIFECDGETEMANSIDIRIIHKALRVLAH